MGPRGTQEVEWVYARGVAMPERDVQTPEAMALSYAKEWAQLPPQHLRVALKTLEPTMQRQHDLLVIQARQRYILDLVGLISGFIVSLASVGSAFFFGLSNNYVMAGVMLSPSVFAITKILILRRSDKRDMRAAGVALAAITQPGGPAPL